MLSGEYPPRWGGMGSTVFHLAGALVRMGHRVTVITRRDKNAIRNPRSIPHQEGVSVLQVKWAPLPMAFTVSYGKWALRELLRIHRKDPVDAVHVHAPMISWKEKQYNMVRETVAPVITSLHGSWLGERDGMIRAAKHGESATWKNPNDLAILLTAKHYAKYERAAVRASTLCVANSEATKRDFQARYNPPEGWRCEVVRWGVDTDMFVPLDADHEDTMLAHENIRNRYGSPDENALAGRSDTNTPLILAVGRLVARKGFRTLLKSMPSVLKSHPGAHLVIVGRGHMKRTLERQAKKLGVSDSVTIEPGMPFEDLAQLFRSANLVAYPSYYEGQGLIPLEAMASGTPVVTVDDGPLPEMVDESVGALFNLETPNSLADSINDLLSNHEIRTTMAAAGRRRVLDEYTYALNAERYAEFYANK
ncbi:MAG: glycosyltransferase family 4 protein [Candidatus Thalassarchaeaceae archaeon]|nr:glycosyltransferase family 4 protein [Candidatus Thalassarchaeaceae archaeon]